MSSPRIFNDLMAPADARRRAGGHSAAKIESPTRRAAAGSSSKIIGGRSIVLPPRLHASRMLDSIVKARGGTGAPTAADSAALRAALPGDRSRR